MTWGDRVKIILGIVFILASTDIWINSQETWYAVRQMLFLAIIILISYIYINNIEDGR